MEHKYIKVEVTRSEGTDLYLKVPAHFSKSDLTQALLKKACHETLIDDDWNNSEWENTLEWQAIDFVDQSEAEMFEIFEVKT